MSLLKVQNLGVDFLSSGRSIRAVDGVSFDINHGETLALVGESGSGKSVTALSILQLLPYPLAQHPYGSIHFDDIEMLQATRAELQKIRGDRVSMIFQDFSGCPRREPSGNDLGSQKHAKIGPTWFQNRSKNVSKNRSKNGPPQRRRL